VGDPLYGLAGAFNVCHSCHVKSRRGGNAADVREVIVTRRLMTSFDLDNQ
jgi:hypothetical protein